MVNMRMLRRLLQKVTLHLTWDNRERNVNLHLKAIGLHYMVFTSAYTLSAHDIDKKNNIKQ